MPYLAAYNPPRCNERSDKGYGTAAAVPQRGPRRHRPLQLGPPAVCVGFHPIALQSIAFQSAIGNTRQRLKQKAIRIGNVVANAITYCNEASQKIT